MSYFGPDGKPDYWDPAPNQFIAGVEPGYLIPDTATEIHLNWGDAFGRFGVRTYSPPGRTPDGQQAIAGASTIFDAWFCSAPTNPASTDSWYWNEVEGWHTVATDDPDNTHKFAGLITAGDVPPDRHVDWVAVTFIKPGLAIHGTATWPYPEPGTIRASLASGGSRQVRRRVAGATAEMQPFVVPAGSDLLDLTAT